LRGPDLRLIFKISQLVIELLPAREAPSDLRPLAHRSARPRPPPREALRAARSRRYRDFASNAAMLN
jgi:hypothetical protein